MRFTGVILAYFLIGAMMWGGGVIDWQEAGVGQVLLSTQDQGNIDTNQNTSQSLQRVGGPVEEAAASVSGGGLLAVMSLVLKLVGFLFWPITVLVSVEAPRRIIVVLGGALSIALLTVTIRLIRGA